MNHEHQHQAKADAAHPGERLVMRQDKPDQPEAYMERLRRLRQRNKYARNWPLRIERKMNRHSTCGGYRWGWYEISPLGIEVGFWNNETGRDDMAKANVDVEDWNRHAWNISMAKEGVGA